MLGIVEYFLNFSYFCNKKTFKIKKMKKGIFLLFTLIACALVLASCT